MQVFGIEEYWTATDLRRGKLLKTHFDERNSPDYQYYELYFDIKAAEEACLELNESRAKGYFAFRVVIFHVK